MGNMTMELIYTTNKEVKKDLCKTCKKGDVCQLSTKIFSNCTTYKCYMYEETEK